MDAREIQRIIRETAHESVMETLKGVGLNIDDQHETQADMLYLRKIRKGSEFISLRIRAAMIACLIPTLLYILWEAVKNNVHK